MTVGTVEPIRLGITVAVPPERAWDVFTKEMASWWPLETHSLAAEDGRRPDRVVVEPGVGGEIYEQLDGVRRHWARITFWAPPHRLVYAWRVNPENPPTEVEVTFSADGGGTRVEITHSGWEAYGERGAEMRANYGADDGWAKVVGSFEEFLNEGN